MREKEKKQHPQQQRILFRNFKCFKTIRDYISASF